MNLKKITHLSEIYKSYDTFIIDLWGVMHDGVALHNDAEIAVRNLVDKNKRVVFLSNAPRPNSDVVKFLKSLNMSDRYLKNIMTSGQAAITALKSDKFGKSFFHVGPERDSSIYNGFKNKKTTIEKCDFILCTGLFDEHETELEYYKKLFKKYTNKKLICTNPDLTVHRGNVVEICAGAVAKVFFEIGGQVVYFGKPHEEIYKLILKRDEKNLVIGDNLNTDIKGANNLKLDSLFVTNGVHRHEFKEDEELDNLLDSYKVKANYFQKNMCW